MVFYYEGKQSFKKSLNKEDWKQFAKDCLVFISPVLALFFGQLAMGISWKVAAMTALLALYQALANLFKKWSKGIDS